MSCVTASWGGSGGSVGVGLAGGVCAHAVNAQSRAGTNANQRDGGGDFMGVG